MLNYNDIGILSLFQTRHIDISPIPNHLKLDLSQTIKKMDA